MATTYFYGGIQYSGDDIAMIVDFLSLNPEELQDYQDTTLRNILGLMSLGDYRSPPEAFAVMCRVMAAVRTANGEEVLQP